MRHGSVTRAQTQFVDRSISAAAQLEGLIDRVDADIEVPNWRRAGTAGDERK
jgi:hypothetical protein